MVFRIGGIQKVCCTMLRAAPVRFRRYSGSIACILTRRVYRTFIVSTTAYDIFGARARAYACARLPALYLAAHGLAGPLSSIPRGGCCFGAHIYNGPGCLVSSSASITPLIASCRSVAARAVSRDVVISRATRTRGCRFCSRGHHAIWLATRGCILRLSRQRAARLLRSLAVFAAYFASSRCL